MPESVMPQLSPRDKCTGCGACCNGCPKGAIHMEPDAEGFLIPVVTAGCIQCGHCTHVCPVLKQREERSAPAVFAAWAEDEDLRQNSTKGGVFGALATQILEDGGVVFGVTMDEQLKARHVAVKNTADLRPLLGAKPVQSDVGDSYQQVRMYLDQGRRVLFTGTPCQVDGLYRYLGEHPENLLTCDLLCSGVASPGVWERLVRSMAYVKQKKPVSVCFCHKLPRGKEKLFRVTFEGGSTYDAPLNKTEFGRGLSRALFLRPVCHACPYATTNRTGDLSLGGYQGLPKDFYPDEQAKGVTLLLINTIKGAHAVDTLSLKKHARPLDEAVAGNSALRTSQAPSPEREQFFTALRQHPFQQVRVKYLSAVAYRTPKPPKPAEKLGAFLKEKLWKKR